MGDRNGPEHALKREIEKKEEKLGDYKKRLKSQAVRMHQMTVAMWEHMPEECGVFQGSCRLSC